MYKCFRVMKLLYALIVFVFPGLYTFVKTCRMTKCKMMLSIEMGMTGGRPSFRSLESRILLQTGYV